MFIRLDGLVALSYILLRSPCNDTYSLILTPVSILLQVHYPPEKEAAELGPVPSNAGELLTNCSLRFRTHPPRWFRAAV